MTSETSPAVPPSEPRTIVGRYPSNDFDPEVGVAEDDAAITTEHVRHPASGELRAYVARPAGSAPAPGVLVIHENKGLTPYVEDATRRLAKRGFVALAPDLLSRVGGSEAYADNESAVEALRGVSTDQMVEDLSTWTTELIEGQWGSTGKLGVIGFCFGGRMAWTLATRDDRLTAVVPLYGGNPPIQDFATINGAVLGIYGELDGKVTAQVPEIEQMLTDHGKDFQIVVYPGASHAFHNDSNPRRYHPESARAAWLEATAWLDRLLK